MLTCRARLKRILPMKHHTKQHTILLLCMICVGLTVSVCPLLAQSANAHYINCTLPNIANGVGCVITFTYGSPFTAAKGIIPAAPTPATHHIYLVCQPDYPKTTDLTTPVPVERALGRQITAFSCPPNAGSLVLRCEIGDQESL